MRHFAFIIVALSLLCGCSKSDSFKVTLQIDKAEAPDNISVYYYGDSGLVKMEIAYNPQLQQAVTISGRASSLTVLRAFSGQRRQLVAVPVENGDELEVLVDLNDIYNVKIEGSKTAERWGEWLNKHNQLLSMGPAQELDGEISKYIGENPKDIMSTLLLMTYFSDLSSYNTVDSLLLSISEEARPSSLVQSYQAFHEKKEDGADKASKKIYSVTMFDSQGDFSSFFNSRGKCSVLYFWKGTDADRRTVIKSLKELKEKYGKRLQVADIFIDTDTMSWRSRFKADSTSWEHYWVPGPLMNSNLERYKVADSPSFIVTDSVGEIHYNGQVSAAAMSAVKLILK